MRLTPFSWYGGKTSMLNKLLPIINGTKHTTYVEPFGGSAAVLLNKEPSPVEIYNDQYGDVVNFFRSLRDEPDELIRRINLTPYSRDEFEQSIEREECPPVEKARRFFVTARQVMMGLATVATPGRWCVAANQSRRGMPLVVSRWLSAAEKLSEVAGRLKTVLIENLDGLEVFNRYDGPNTLTYLDPPYPMETRSGGVGYRLEFTDGQHDALLAACRKAKGKVVLSSYANPRYDDALSGWSRVVLGGESKASHYHKGASYNRSEVVWANFTLERAGLEINK